MSIKYKNSDIISVANITELFTLKNLNDNQLVQTQGYSTEGMGANLYRYDSGSSATIDGVFTFPGISGVLSFSGTTFNGTAGTGRFITVDSSKADVIKAGAIGDGVTNDTNAIQRAMLAAQTNTKTLYFPPGTYVHDTISITDGVTIRCDGQLLHTKDSGKFSIDMPFGSSVSCTISDQALISGSQMVYTHKITAAGHGLIKGTYLKFVRASATAGEIAKVLEVIDTDNFTIDHTMEEIVAGDSGVVYYEMPTGRLDIELNVISDEVDGNWPAAHAVLEVNGAIHPRIKLNSGNILKTGVQLRSVAGGTIYYSQRDNGDAIDMTNAENRFGYGVIAASATCGTQVFLDCEGGRHAFTTADGIATIHYGQPVDVVVSGICRNSHSPPFDTHAYGRRIAFVNCLATFNNTLQEGSGTSPIGFQNRSKDTIYQNCRVHGARRGFELISTIANSTVIMQNIIVDNTTAGGIMYNEASSSKLLIDGYIYRDTATSSGAFGYALGMYNAPVRLRNAYFERGASSSQAIRMAGTGAGAILDIDGLEYSVSSGGPAPIFYSYSSGTASVYLRNYVNRGAAPVSLFRVEAGTLSYKLENISFDNQVTTFLVASLFGAGAVTSLNVPYDNGNSGASKNIFWGALAYDQKITLTANTTLVFFAPPHPTSLRLSVIQDGTGTRTVTWPTIIWKTSGLQPDPTGGATSIYEFYYNGSGYYEMNVNN